MTDRLVIIDGLRTPFCPAGGALAALSADHLGRLAVDALLTKTGLDPALLDEVIFGCGAPPPGEENIARRIALRAGLPATIPALTLQRGAASGLEAFTTAAERLAAGRGSVFIVGGAESVSRVPLQFPETTARKFKELARSKSAAQKLGALSAFRVADFGPREPLANDPTDDSSLGAAADRLAREDGCTRAQQDAFAVRSHQRATAAATRLAEEICPVYLGGQALLHDAGPRADPALGELPPVFEKYGTVTAGNAAPPADGAVALLVMGESRARALGFTPLAALTAYACAGVDPAQPGLAPLAAITRLAAQCPLTAADANFVELDETFAAHALGVLARLQPAIPAEKLNINGGSIALGHPTGATGARLLLTAAKELARRRGRRALIALGTAGGLGAALWLEKIDHV